MPGPALLEKGLSDVPIREADRGCPHCGAIKTYALKCRPARKCPRCDRQFSDTSTTRFRAHKFPVEVLEKIEEMSGTMSIRKIAAALGVNYRTVWARVRQYESHARTGDLA